MAKGLEIYKAGAAASKGEEEELTAMDNLPVAATAVEMEKELDSVHIAARKGDLKRIK